MIIRRRGLSLSKLRAPLMSERKACEVPFGLEEDSISGSKSIADNGTIVSEEIDTDEEDGSSGLVIVRSQLSPIAACREHSGSAWLYFPHVELLFLFFAFEGAVGAQATAIGTAGCPQLLGTAAAALVSPMGIHVKKMGSRSTRLVGVSLSNKVQSHMAKNANEG